MPARTSGPEDPIPTLMLFAHLGDIERICNNLGIRSVINEVCDLKLSSARYIDRRFICWSLILGYSRNIMNVFYFKSVGNVL